MKRGLSALIVVDALVGLAALMAILVYFLARREEEAEFVLLVVLLVVCCANAVVIAIFRRETGDHLQSQGEIREELAAIRGMLERETGASSSIASPDSPVVGRSGASSSAVGARAAAGSSSSSLTSSQYCSDQPTSAAPTLATGRYPLVDSIPE